MRYRELAKKLQEFGCDEFRQGIISGTIRQPIRLQLCPIGAAKTCRLAQYGRLFVNWVLIERILDPLNN